MKLSDFDKMDRQGPDEIVLPVTVRNIDGGSKVTVKQYVDVETETIYQVDAIGKVYRMQTEEMKDYSDWIPLDNS